VSRPRKWKKVCCLPESSLYGPLGTKHRSEIIAMSVEEYETLRLIDLEGLTQEECGERMQVARTTVQKIYTDARAKVAESLVNGCLLKIEGGDYQLYNEKEKPLNCRKCARSRCHRGRMGNRDFQQNNKEGESDENEC